MDIAHEYYGPCPTSHCPFQSAHWSLTAYMFPKTPLDHACIFATEYCFINSVFICICMWLCAHELSALRGWRRALDPRAGDELCKSCKCS